MKRTSFIIFIALSFSIISSGAPAQQPQVEQQPGEPLYFPKGEVTEHPSDLAPESDPKWKEEKARREKAGESVKELYEVPTESYYETTTRYETVDKKKKKDRRRGHKRGPASH